MSERRLDQKDCAPNIFLLDHIHCQFLQRCGPFGRLLNLYHYGHAERGFPAALAELPCSSPQWRNPSDTEGALRTAMGQYFDYRHCGLLRIWKNFTLACAYQ